jgi:hypothetical protein
MDMLIYLLATQLAQDYEQPQNQRIFEMIFTSIMATITDHKRLLHQRHQLPFTDTKPKPLIQEFILE